jgi:hypothetical protein
MNVPDNFSKSLETIADPDLGSGIFLTLDPGWKKSDRGSGININIEERAGFPGRAWPPPASPSPASPPSTYSVVPCNTIFDYFVIFFAKSILF